MSWLRNLWHAYIRERNRRRRWANRTTYTWPQDDRNWSVNYMKDFKRWTR